MNLFYIENTYSGNNLVTLTVDKTSNPSAGSGFATQVEYSKDGTNWTTWTLDSNRSIGLSAGEKVYFRNNNNNFWSYYDSSMYRCYTFKADQSHNVGGDLSTLANGSGASYARLFKGDNTLVSAADLVLPSTTSSYSLYQMFYGCTHLTSAPTLTATSLSPRCYKEMFYNCSTLTSVRSNAQNISATDCLQNWLSGVSATGTFYNDGDITYPTGASGIPTGWTEVKPIDYFYIENTYNGQNTVTLTTTGSGASQASSVEYSKDKNSWTTLTLTAGGTNTITLETGEKVYFRNDSGMWSSGFSNYTKFTANQNHTVGGNVNTLIDYTDLNSVTLSNYCFYGLFKGSYYLTSATNLSLPSTTLAFGCYREMFSGCTALTATPTLPATTLATYCYTSMFYGCTSLTAAPSLPATTLAESCYSSMFQSCPSLTTAPSLPATTLAMGCYSYMFQSCPSLTTAPSLPVTTLASYCYNGMFTGCTALTATPTLPATTLAGGCYNSMFMNCTSLTTAPTLPATTLAGGCYTSMFKGCTSLTAAPSLPATTLAESCYSSMFQSCPSLTTAPSLPATTLAMECYSSMFMGCTHLTTAPTLPATTLARGCYYRMFWNCNRLNSVTTYANNIAYESINGWLQGVANSGTFYNNGSATYTPNSASGIPTGWTEVLPSKTITATAGSNGSISPSGAVSVNIGSDQTFTFTPDTGYEVDTVTVDGSTVTPTNNTYTFTNVQSDHTISVTFKVQTFTINAISEGHTTVNPSGLVTVNYGASQTFTFSPEIGYELDKLYIDGVETAFSGSSYTFTNVQSDHTLEITSKLRTFTIEASSSEGGSITPDGIITVDYDDDATFEVIPSTGYLLWELLVDGTDKKDELVDNTYTFENVTANHTIHAVFDDIYLIVSVTSGPNGSITPTGDVEVIYNGNQIFNITPNEGYEIDKVMLDGVDVTDDVEDFNYTMRNIVENHILEVSFKETYIPEPKGFNLTGMKNTDYAKQYKK